MKRRWLGWLVASGVMLAMIGVGGFQIYKKIETDRAENAKREAEKKKPKVLALVATDLHAIQTKPVAPNLQLIGTLEPMAQGVAKARAAGTLIGASKREGDTVRAGEVLANVDSADLRIRVTQQESLRAQAQAQLDVAEKNRAAQQSLLEKGFISKTAFDNTEGTFLAAKAGLDAAQAQVNIATQALRDTSIVAPLAGVISRRHIEPGERVTNEMTVYTIMQIDALEFAPQVPAEEAAKLSVGQTIEVNMTGVEKPYTATISRIAPAAVAGTRTVDVRAKIRNDSRVLKAGVSAIGIAALGTAKDALVVSVDAVRTPDIAPHIFIKDGNVARRKEVKLGARDERTGTIVIVSGAQAGDQVITARVLDVKDGQAVKLAGATDAKKS